jgi:tRNA-dihydrouridine synthase B
MKLGTLTLSSPFILAPLESVSDCAFRRVCWDRGASLTWTEMIRARGLVRNNKSTFDLIDTYDAEVLTGVQLMVTNERELEGALSKLEGATQAHFKNIRAIDLNFGCPSPDIIRIGAGPALLKRHGKLRTLFQTLRAWQKVTTLPIGAVGAKIRLGLNRAEQEQKVYLPLVELANEHLDYLVIHARHARQNSTEAPSWDALAEANQRATVPIIGNGNVTNAQDWQRMSDSTGVAGALIARAAIRSPWVFRELRNGESGLPIAMEEIDQAEQQYFDLASKHQTKVKFVNWHREGFARMRARLMGTSLNGPDVPANENLG